MRSLHGIFWHFLGILLVFLATVLTEFDCSRSCVECVCLIVSLVNASLCLPNDTWVVEDWNQVQTTEAIHILSVFLLAVDYSFVATA
jgi:hypothetical protein